MKVKIITTIWGDLENINYPDVINSDTVGDYKAELDAAVSNAALQQISFSGDYDVIQIDSIEPYEDGIDEYGTALNQWMKTYPEEVKNLIEKYHEG